MTTNIFKTWNVLFKTQTNIYLLKHVISLSEIYLFVKTHALKPRLIIAIS